MPSCVVDKLTISLIQFNLHHEREQKMRVIFTGQMGMLKEEIVTHFSNLIIQHLRLTGSTVSKDVLLIDKVEKHIPHPERVWMQTPDVEDQYLQWQTGFRKSLETSNGYKNVFLCMHAVIYKYNRYISPVDWGLMRDFKPDLFITFIDDVIDIWWRLQYGPGGTGEEEYKLREIMAWRSAEIMATEMLARNLFETRCPHFVIAVKHPVLMLQRLILEPERLRVYSAYPITDAKKAIEDKNIDARIIKDVDENRRRLHEKHITFDPITIDEFDLIEMLKRRDVPKSDSAISFNREEDRWAVKSEFCNFQLLSDAIEYPDVIENIDPNQISEIESDMSFQISWRDYGMLDQVHCMAAFRPTFNKGSQGVQKELLYAEMKKIASYQYRSNDDKPFVKPFIDTGLWVTDYEEYLRLVAKHQEEVTGVPQAFSHHAEFEL